MTAWLKHGNMNISLPETEYAVTRYARGVGVRGDIVLLGILIMVVFFKALKHMREGL